MNKGWFAGVNANTLPSAQLLGVPFAYGVVGGYQNGFQVPRSEYFDPVVLTSGAASTISNRNGRLAISVSPSATLGAAMYFRLAPSPPYTIDLHGLYVGAPNTNPTGVSLGIALQNAQGTVRIVEHTCEVVSANTRFQGFQISSVTASAETILSRSSISTRSSGFYCRATDDGTTRRYWMSANGLDFFQYYNEASSVLGYATKIGIIVGASLDAAMPVVIAMVDNFVVTTSILGDSP